MMRDFYIRPSEAVTGGKGCNLKKLATLSIVLAMYEMENILPFNQSKLPNERAFGELFGIHVVKKGHSLSHFMSATLTLL